MSFSPVLGPRQPPRLIKMLISAHRLADIPVRLPAASRVSPPFPMCPCFPVSLSPFSSVSPRVPPWTRSLSRPSPLLSHFVPLSRHAAVVSFPIFPTPPPPERVGGDTWMNNGCPCSVDREISLFVSGDCGKNAPFLMACMGRALIDVRPRAGKLGNAGEIAAG